MADLRSTLLHCSQTLRDMMDEEEIKCIRQPRTGGDLEQIKKVRVYWSVVVCGLHLWFGLSVVTLLLLYFSGIYIHSYNLH